VTRAEWWTKHVLGGFWASFGSVWAVFLKSIWQRWKAFRQSLSLDMWLREVFFGALLSTFNYRQSGPRESVEVSYVKIYGWPKWLKRRTNYPGPKWPRPEVVIHRFVDVSVKKNLWRRLAQCTERRGVVFIDIVNGIAVIVLCRWRRALCERLMQYCYS